MHFSRVFGRQNWVSVICPIWHLLLAPAADWSGLMSSQKRLKTCRWGNYKDETHCANNSLSHRICTELWHPSFYESIYVLNWRQTLHYNSKKIVKLWTLQLCTSTHFGATVCKTVRPMLSDRCPVCLSVLSVTLMCCGQKVGRIKMKLGVQVGRPRPRPQCVRWGPSFPSKGAQPLSFWPVSIVAKRSPISAAAEFLLFEVLHLSFLSWSEIVFIA